MAVNFQTGSFLSNFIVTSEAFSSFGSFLMFSNKVIDSKFNSRMTKNTFNIYIYFDTYKNVFDRLIHYQFWEMYKLKTNSLKDEFQYYVTSVKILTYSLNLQNFVVS